MNTVAICSFWSCGSGNEACPETGPGYRVEPQFRLPRSWCEGPQQGLACDAEYRVEAGENGQT